MKNKTKTFVALAVSSLIAGSLVSSQAFAGDDAHHDKDKGEHADKDSCKGGDKDSCKGHDKDSCKGQDKDSCKGKDGCNGKE